MNNKRFKKINLEDNLSFKEGKIKGHVIVKDGETGEILTEKDNLVLMRTRVFVFEHLFKVSPPSSYSCIKNNNRQICLFKIGQGGADVNAAAFNPYTPKFSDKDLSQPVPFITVHPDKDSDATLDSNPSIVTELTNEQKLKYHLPKQNPDGSVSYYGKIFEPESKGWVIDNNTGEVAYSLSLRIEENEARGYIINEIGTILAEPQPNKQNPVTFIADELCSRITFDSESLTSLNKSIEIEYIFYI